MLNVPSKCLIVRPNIQLQDDLIIINDTLFFKKFDSWNRLSMKEEVSVVKSMSNFPSLSTMYILIVITCKCSPSRSKLFALVQY